MVDVWILEWIDEISVVLYPLTTHILIKQVHEGPKYDDNAMDSFLLHSSLQLIGIEKKSLT